MQSATVQTPAAGPTPPASAPYTVKGLTEAILKARPNNAPGCEAFERAMMSEASPQEKAAALSALIKREVRHAVAAGEITLSWDTNAGVKTLVAPLPSQDLFDEIDAPLDFEELGADEPESASAETPASEGGDGAPQDDAGEGEGEEGDEGDEGEAQAPTETKLPVNTEPVPKTLFCALASFVSEDADVLIAVSPATKGKLNVSFFPKSRAKGEDFTRSFAVTATPEELDAAEDGFASLIGCRVTHLRDLKTVQAELDAAAKAEADAKRAAAKSKGKKETPKADKKPEPAKPEPAEPPLFAQEAAK